MYELKISFFGPFTLSFGESVLREDSLRSHKQWRLIKYLLLNRGRAIERRELIDATFGYGAYFGESEKALNALNAILHRARGTLEKAGIPVHIKHLSGKYFAELPDGVEIDCDCFEQLVSAVFSGGDVRSIKEKALKASEIYRGFFLDGNYFDEKNKLSGEKYHSDYKRVMSVLFGALRREESFSLLAKISRRAIEIDPMCQDFCVEYIGALLSAGDIVGAKKEYLAASEFFESKTSVIISGEFRELGKKLDTKNETAVLLPKEYADREQAVSDAVSKVLDGAKVRISLI